MMKKLAKYLRAMIATGSVLGFLGGWVLIAHAGKPAPTQAPLPIIAPAPAPTLAPLPSFGGAPSNLQPLPALPQISSMPRLRLRTGGS
jgi:hypothetical protein